MHCINYLKLMILMLMLSLYTACNYNGIIKYIEQLETKNSKYLLISVQLPMRLGSRDLNYLIISVQFPWSIVASYILYDVLLKVCSHGTISIFFTVTNGLYTVFTWCDCDNDIKSHRAHYL